MRRINSTIDINSTQFLSYKRHNEKLLAELLEKEHNARHDRPQKDIDRLARQGKMMPHQRIDLLIDPGTPFMELSSLAANESRNGEVAGASVVTGIGIINLSGRYIP